MNQDLDFLLANLQNGKITDVDSLKNSLCLSVKSCNENPKFAALLSTKAFDPVNSLMYFLESRSTVNDNLAKSTKRAICDFMIEFMRSQPQPVQPYLEFVFVSSTGLFGQLLQERKPRRRQRSLLESGQRSAEPAIGDGLGIKPEPRRLLPESLERSDDLRQQHAGQKERLDHPGTVQQQVPLRVPQSL